MDHLAEIQHVLNKAQLFHSLSEKEKRHLAENSTLVKYGNREHLFKQKSRISHVLYVLNGLVKVFKENHHGRVVSLKVISGGHFAGLDTFFGQSEYKYSASSVGDTEALMIDFATLVNQVVDNGKFALTLIREISMDALFIFDRLNSQSTKQLPGRVADVLLYFAEQIYHSYSFTFPLPRYELAELAGSTKESFIRTLNEFKHDKIIDLDGREVKIISLELVKILCELG
ncbi:MAG: Crp/Fnr family transcriptional regulator [Chlorobi bacterium]|nr:Crp/Fnr family transcriptional regulator [Chlorobiota bacterium]